MFRAHYQGPGAASQLAQGCRHPRLRARARRQRREGGHVTSPVKLALVDVCAGSASTLPDLNVLTKEVEAGLAAALADPPVFLCFFTFGEQGMVDGKPQHCNLMVNVALVG